MSIECTIMVECRIADSPRTEAHKLRVGQPVLFGARVCHVDDAQFTDTYKEVKVTLVHYDQAGVKDTQTVTVDKLYQFDCLQIVALKAVASDNT